MLEHNIYYQSIEIRDENSIKILCNDAEEREHIKHILLKHYTILSVDIEGKRFFTKFATEEERDTFKYMKSLDPEKKAKILENIKRENEASAAMEAERRRNENAPVSDEL